MFLRPPNKVLITWVNFRKARPLVHFSTLSSKISQSSLPFRSIIGTIESASSILMP